MAWTSYRNPRASTQVISYCTSPLCGSPGHKHKNRAISLSPGSVFTFDHGSGNGTLVEQACVNGGLVLAGRG